MPHRVLLLNAAPYKNYSVKTRVYFPSLLLYLATIVKSAGFAVSLIDRVVDDMPDARLREWVEKNGSELVATIIHFTTKEVPDAILLGDLVHAAAPHVKVVAVGLHSAMYPNQVIEDPAFDVVVQGDAEPAVVALLRSLTDEADSKVPNVWWKRGGAYSAPPACVDTNMDDLPVFDFGVIDLKKYIQRDVAFLTGNNELCRVFRFSASRGCIYKCSFCTDPFKGYKRMQNSTIVRHLDAIVEAADPDIVFFDDPEFFIRKNETLELMDKIAKRYRFKCITTSRAQYYREDYISKEVMRRFSKRWMLWDVGGETASADRLRDMRKGITFDQLRQVSDYAGEVGVRAGFSFMVGMPGESEREMLDTVFFMEDLKRRARGNIAITYQYYQPIGPTVMTRSAEALGFQSPKTLRQWRETFDIKTGSTSIYLHPWVPRPEFVDYLRLVVKYVVNESYSHDEVQFAKLIGESWLRRKDQDDWSNLPEQKACAEAGLSFFSPR